MRRGLKARNVTAWAEARRARPRYQPEKERLRPEGPSRRAEGEKGWKGIEPCVPPFQGWDDFNRAETWASEPVALQPWLSQGGLSALGRRLLRGATGRTEF